MSMLKTRVELDVHTLEEIRLLLRPVVLKACANRLGDSIATAYEIAEEIETELLKTLTVNSSREQNKQRDYVNAGAIYNAGQIKNLLKDVPDNRRVLTQIVGAQTGVYNAYIEMGILKDGEGPVVMSAGHPELAHLSVCLDVDDRHRKIDQLVNLLNELR